MKKLIMGIAMCLFLFPFISFANEITIEWDPNVEVDISYYNLYQGTESGIYGPTPVNVDHPTTEAKVQNLSDGTYYWAVSAVDFTGNEGPKSKEVMHIFSAGTPMAPGGIRKKIVIEIPIP